MSDPAGREATCCNCYVDGHCCVPDHPPCPVDMGRVPAEETHPVAPDEKGCYGWPRTCDHDDDLDCMTAEQKADRG